MDLGKVFDYVNYTTNKDALGEPLSAEKFNMLIKVANTNYYNDRYKDVLSLADSQGISIGVKLFNDTPLFRFLTSINYAFGNIIPELAPLPDDLGFTLGATMKYNNIWRPGELLDVESFNNRRYNVMSPSLKRKPIFIEKPNGYKFVPHNTRSAIVDYLRAPITPKFDYCAGLDDDEIYFMEVGTQIKKDLTDPEVYNLYDANGREDILNVKHLTYEGEYPYFSTTVELDWKEDDITKIADSIVAIASIKSREFNVAQSAAQAITE